MSKIKNIIIFIAIAAAFVLIYIFFIKPPSNQANLVSSTALPNVNTTADNSSSSATANADTSLVAKDFLTLLLNVKNIKINDAIFSDEAFISLHDSSIVLIPDGTEGRPNPFAKFGNDNVVTPAVTP